MPTSQALARAQELDLDLVEVAPQADPPVCRLMDYGKWKYEQDVRAKEARKRQSQVVVKEMKYRPKISVHDYETKTRRVEEFLRSGFKVKVTVMLRGRENDHPELGQKVLDRMVADVSEIASVESPPKLFERNIVMMLSPLKRPQAKPGRPTEPAERRESAAGG